MTCIIEFQLFSFPSQRNHFMRLQKTGVVVAGAVVAGTVVVGAGSADQWILQACILFLGTCISFCRRRLDTLSSGQWVLQPLNDYLTPHNLINLLAILLFCLEKTPKGLSKQRSNLVQLLRAAHKADIPLPPYRVIHLLGNIPSLYWRVPV